MKFQLIHTNDVHSHFEEFAKAVSLIKSHYKENTLVLDGGDFADFRSIELQGTKGHAALELLKEAKYDALTIGNNETFNGMDTLEGMAHATTVPFISNNIKKTDGTAIEGVRPYILIEGNDIRFLITGSSPDLGVFNEGLGLQVDEPATALRNVLQETDGQYDVCILLSHVGTEMDEKLAHEFTEIDLIVSAHDHKLFHEPKEVNGAIHVSAGNYGQYVGVHHFEVENGVVKVIDSMMISTKEQPADDEIQRILREQKSLAIHSLKQPLYSLSEPLWHDVIEENPMTNLIADGLRDMLDCDLGLINSGIANAGLFHYVSRKKLIEVCPSPLNPTIIKIEGRYLRKALEQSLDVQACLADGRGPGFRGKFVGRLHVSGAEIVTDGETIQHILVNEQPLDETHIYTVATSDYLQRGSGYPMLANNEEVLYRAEEIKDVIEQYASKEEMVENAQTNRWKISSSLLV